MSSIFDKKSCIDHNLSHRPKRGFSLVEVLVSISIFSLVCLGLGKLLISTSAQETYSEADIIADKIVQSVFTQICQSSQTELLTNTSFPVKIDFCNTDGSLASTTETLTSGLWAHFNLPVQFNDTSTPLVTIPLEISWNRGGLSVDKQGIVQNHIKVKYRYRKQATTAEKDLTEFKADNKKGLKTGQLIKHFYVSLS